MDSKLSNWKCAHCPNWANARIFSLTTCQSQKRMPRADLKSEGPYLYSKVKCFSMLPFQYSWVHCSMMQFCTVQCSSFVPCIALLTVYLRVIRPHLQFIGIGNIGKPIYRTTSSPVLFHINYGATFISSWDPCHGFASTNTVIAVGWYSVWRIIIAVKVQWRNAWYKR